MARIDTGGVRLNVLQWGSGEGTVVFIHGNLASANWFELIPPLVPAHLRCIAIDWRGCGGSDKPAPDLDFANYALDRHASDMLAVIDALGIERCHLATHSTGGLISLYMLLKAPARFGKVLALDPVGPRGLRFAPESRIWFESMRASRAKTRKGLALTATSLFETASLAPGRVPVFAAHTSEAQRALFERLVDQTCTVSDGIWFGTPKHLNDAWERGDMVASLDAIAHPHRILWGTLDPFIPLPDLQEMAGRMPTCALDVVDGVGHSMLIERPELYARHLTAFLA